MSFEWKQNKKLYRSRVVKISKDSHLLIKRRYFVINFTFNIKSNCKTFKAFLLYSFLTKMEVKTKITRLTINK